MEFKCIGFMAYVISDTEEGCFIHDGNGFFMEADQMIDIGKKLISTAKQKGMKERLEEHNIKRKYNFEEELRPKKSNREPKKKPKSYVYLMECNGIYKIGVAKDVEKRRKQLQTSTPFQIETRGKSMLMEDAYKEEERLHEYYAQYNIGGEWFDLPEMVVLDILVGFDQNKLEAGEYENID